MDKQFLKGVLFTLLVVYVVSPLDLCPGPIDDVIALLIYFAANKKNIVAMLPKKNDDVEVIDTNDKEI